MNTQTKILTPAALAALEPARPLLLATGHFEILQVELVHELSEARRRTASRTLVALILPLPAERLPSAARARMAAALRVIDYVLIAENEDLDRLAVTLQPFEIIHLGDAETARTRQLIEHVRSRQSC